MITKGVAPTPTMTETFSVGDKVTVDGKSAGTVTKVVSRMAFVTLDTGKECYVPLGYLVKTT